MNRKNLIITLAIVFLLLFVASGVVFAAGKDKAYGLLTSIENDGSVIIQDEKGQLKGYLLSPSAAVQEYDGKRELLRDLHLPLKVYIEYEYTTAGFMITLIREVAE